MNQNFELFLGLETHVELKTQQKMFCGCSASYFGAPANSHTCPVCLGLPGALPVPNLEAVRSTILIGLAFNCKINLESYFERKHYFYPDLVKGYQISQYKQPLCFNGRMEVNGQTIRINRIHLEEDTGKLIHDVQGQNNQASYVDFNRCGVPLVEIVTEPDFHDSETAVEYLKKLQLTIQYLGVSNADMEEGSMRCEPNISIALSNLPTFQPANLPPYKVEVKNINSFRFVKKAVEYEVKRQGESLVKGQTPIQETRRYVESTQKTESMRSKEDSKDYRYFPEPDIPPLTFTNEFIAKIKQELVEIDLPEKRQQRLIETYKVRPDLAAILIQDKNYADLFLAIAEESNQSDKLAAFMVNQRTALSEKKAKEILAEFKQTTQKQTVGADLLQETVNKIIKENPRAVADYREGKQNAFQFLLGNCLRILGRNTDTREIIAKLKEKLT